MFYFQYTAYSFFCSNSIHLSWVKKLQALITSSECIFSCIFFSLEKKILYFFFFLRRNYWIICLIFTSIRNNCCSFSTDSNILWKCRQKQKVRYFSVKYTLHNNFHKSNYILKGTYLTFFFFCTSCEPSLISLFYLT